MNKYDKARIKLSKQTAKEMMEGDRPQFAGAFIDGEKQIILNGYIIGVYNDIVEDCVKCESEIKYEMILESSNYYCNNNYIIDIDLNKIKEEYKNWELNPVGSVCVIQIENAYYDAKFIVDIIDTFKNPVFYLDTNFEMTKFIHFKNENTNTNPLRIIADNGIGLILARRGSDNGR